MNAPTPSKRYPEILEDLAAKLAAMLVEEGVAGGDRAVSIGFRFAERLRRDWGGSAIYIPVGAGYDTDNLAREVFRRWDGRNTRELAEEFGISERRVRQLHSIGRRIAAPQEDDEPPAGPGRKLTDVKPTFHDSLPGEPVSRRANVALLVGGPGHGRVTWAPKAPASVVFPHADGADYEYRWGKFAFGGNLYEVWSHGNPTIEDVRRAISESNLAPVGPVPPS